MKLLPGTLVNDKYRVLRLIGDGGMGSVYEARHEGLGASVALKFLHSELAQNPGLASRFLQEARVSATIQSPHVIRVTDVDRGPEGAPYLVMEFLLGESLQALLDRLGKLPVGQAVGFASQILSGLEAAHAAGVVHRDLKPDNVVVVPSKIGPLLKIIDFGIAKLKLSDKGLTQAGSVMGTPEYMAPEQLFSAADVDHRADIYSLGVMLFEMLSGKLPAEGEDPQTIISQVVARKVKLLESLEPSLPPGLVQVVNRAMAPDAQGRFESATEFRMELARFASEVETENRIRNVPRTVSMEVRSKAIEPDAGAAALNHGMTERISADLIQKAVQERSAGGVSRVFPAPTLTKRRNSSGLGLGFAFLGLLCAGIAIAIGIALRQNQEVTEPTPRLDPISPPPTATLSALVGAKPPPPVQPDTKTPPPRGSTPIPPPKLPDAGTKMDAGSDAGTGIFFPPLPPLTLPSTLPPLPSTLPPLPSGLPPFPSALPPLPFPIPSTLPPFPNIFPPGPEPDAGG